MSLTNKYLVSDLKKHAKLLSTSNPWFYPCVSLKTNNVNLVRDGKFPSFSCPPTDYLILDDALENLLMN